MICFKASAVVCRRVDGKPIGAFHAIDSCPSIAFHVQRACQQHADMAHGFCTPVELTLFEASGSDPVDSSIRFDFLRQLPRPPALHPLHSHDLPSASDLLVWDSLWRYD